MNWWGGILKRLLDLIIAVPLLILSLPIMFITAVFIYFKMGYPVIFKQLRPGLNGQPFYLYKFRTMLNTKDRDGNVLSDAERLVPLGILLRKLSLDEIPQLWNVIRGDMSLVGPRPLLMEYLPLYSSEQARRHNVKPGITGWAQVNGRNAISWAEKFKLDVWYVDNYSILLDVKILFMTVLKVFKREGINQENSATAEKFQGEQI